jgi:dTDP-4-amino-4,6-dideoxy-D-galactose acyltransferase
MPAKLPDGTPPTAPGPPATAARRCLNVAAVTPLLEPLPWDSDFFGFPIGRAELAGATAERLRSIEDEAHRLGLVCAYGAADPTQADGYLAQTFGYRLVEVAVTFARTAGALPPWSSESRVRPGTVDDLPALEPSIATLAPWSRFGADPRFGPEAARRMHRAWVERCARDGTERRLLVAEDGSGPTGFSTEVHTGVPRIDLMGVVKQGAGASWALMADFMARVGDGVVEGGPCAVRNIAPLRFVEKCGFEVARVEYRFHRWFDEDVGARP